jgi:hypothetical protein
MKKLKKSLSVLLTLCCLISLTFQQPAQASASVISTEKITQDDGYILVTTITPSEASSAISTCSTTHSKEAMRVYSFYNLSGTLCWSYTLNASFLYDGTLVVCTSVSSSSAIYKSGWSACNESHSKSGATATGSIRFKTSTNHKDVSLSITCSKNGTVD